MEPVAGGMTLPGVYPDSKVLLPQAIWRYLLTLSLFRGILFPVVRWFVPALGALIFAHLETLFGHSPTT
jgi:hypothetical protein